MVSTRQLSNVSAEMRADGEVVWSWRPRLASSPWRRFIPTGVVCRNKSMWRRWQ